MATSDDQVLKEILQRLKKVEEDTTFIKASQQILLEKLMPGAKSHVNIAAMVDNTISKFSWSNPSGASTSQGRPDDPAKRQKMDQGPQPMSAAEKEMLLKQKTMPTPGSEFAKPATSGGLYDDKGLHLLNFGGDADENIETDTEVDYPTTSDSSSSNNGSNKDAGDGVQL